MVAATGSMVGSRALGDGGIGCGYVHSAVDDRSRVAISQILPDETGPPAARFLVEAASFFADHSVTIQRVLTDNAKAYTQSTSFQEMAAALGPGASGPVRIGPRPTARSSGQQDLAR